jgi:hypothetical protein
VFNEYFATFASAVSIRGIIPSGHYVKSCFETSDDLCSPQNLLRQVLTPPQEATFGIGLPMQSGGITLDEVNDRLYARRGDASSAATSVNFAHLRGCDQCLRFVTCPPASGPRPYSAGRVRDRPS